MLQLFVCLLEGSSHRGTLVLAMSMATVDVDDCRRWHALGRVEHSKWASLCLPVPGGGANCANFGRGRWDDLNSDTNK